MTEKLVQHAMKVSFGLLSLGGGHKIVGVLRDPPCPMAEGLMKIKQANDKHQTHMRMIGSIPADAILMDLKAWRIASLWGPFFTTTLVVYPDYRFGSPKTGREFTVREQFGSAYVTVVVPDDRSILDSHLVGESAFAITGLSWRDFKPEGKHGMRVEVTDEERLNDIRDFPRNSGGLYRVNWDTTIPYGSLVFPDADQLLRMSPRDISPAMRDLRSPQVMRTIGGGRIGVLTRLVASDGAGSHIIGMDLPPTHPHYIVVEVPEREAEICDIKADYTKREEYERLNRGFG